MKFLLCDTGGEKLLDEYPVLRKYNPESIQTDKWVRGERYYITIQSLDDLIALRDSLKEELIIYREDILKGHIGELGIEIYNYYRE